MTNLLRNVKKNREDTCKKYTPPLRNVHGFPDQDICSSNKQNPLFRKVWSNISDLVWISMNINNTISISTVYINMFVRHKTLFQIVDSYTPIQLYVFQEIIIYSCTCQLYLFLYVYIHYLHGVCLGLVQQGSFGGVGAVLEEPSSKTAPATLFFIENWLQMTLRTKSFDRAPPQD